VDDGRDPARAVDAVVSLNVPYRGWCCGFPNTQFIEKRLPKRFSYVLQFQEPGRPEGSFAKDPAGWLHRIFRGVAKDPDFMPEEDFAVYRDAFIEGGISGPINYYRNMDANWESTPHFAGKKVEQPALMIVTDKDPILRPEMADAVKAAAIRDFLRWMVGRDAAKMAAELHYAPLPASVATLVSERVGTLTSGGNPIPDRE